MKKTQAQTPKTEQRILDRILARELSLEELEMSVGGTGTTSLDMPSGDPGDCDTDAV